jgi:hypothetical protein
LRGAQFSPLFGACSCRVTLWAQNTFSFQAPGDGAGAKLVTPSHWINYASDCEMCVAPCLRSWTDAALAELTKNRHARRPAILALTRVFRVFVVGALAHAIARAAGTIQYQPRRASPRERRQPASRESPLRLGRVPARSSHGRANRGPGRCRAGECPSSRMALTGRGSFPPRLRPARGILSLR